MAAWEYNILITNVVDIAKATNIGYGKAIGAAFSPGTLSAEMRPDISRMWQVPGTDGVTDWDRLQKMGREGWELVTCVTFDFGGFTMQMIWTFKRQIVEG